MAEEGDETPIALDDDDEIRDNPNYKAPAQKTIDEIKNLDTDDESLKKYKSQLLGDCAGGDKVFFPNDPRTVILESLVIVVTDGPEIKLNLNEMNKKQEKIIIKEGVQYRQQFTFYVQKEIVSGLRCHQVTKRKGITVDKTNYMVGSYGPKKEPHVYTTPPEDAPKGLVARGTYSTKIKFLDDDKTNHLEVEWEFDIKKDWS